MSKRVRGRVKFFKVKEGYGMIWPPVAGDKDIFVHYSNVDMEGFKILEPNELVEYTPILTSKGTQAANVTRLDQI